MPSLINDSKLIAAEAERRRQFWPPLLQENISHPWHKTLADDINGLVSGLPLAILRSAHKTAQNWKKAVTLGAANLYLWTAANLQDDICDEPSAHRSGIPIANACLGLAWKLLDDPDQAAWIRADAANLQELLFPQIIPEGDLAAAGKSSFLLLAPLALSRHLGWNKADCARLELALSYFLACKQLSDDVYDYREDWLQGRRNYAHRGLTRLPEGKELSPYFRRQADIILSLAAKAKAEIKKISALQDGDCLGKFLEPIELNCQRALAKLSERGHQA